MPETITEYPHFFTATNLEWKKVLFNDKYKDIIIESLRFLAKNKRVIIYGFVIMENHIHVIWQLQANTKKEDVHRDFLKFTAQQIKKEMIKSCPEELANYKVDAKDRKYQFCERNPLSIEIWSEKSLTSKTKIYP